MTGTETCQDRVERAMESRIDDLRKLWEAYCDGDEDRHCDDLGNMCEYGVCFDYVAAGTFTDQKTGYFRFQISYGGPSEEFRFYTDPEFNVESMAFWFLDWFDGAESELTGEDFKLLDEIFDSFFKDSGTVEHVYNQATEDC